MNGEGSPRFVIAKEEASPPYLMSLAVPESKLTLNPELMALLVEVEGELERFNPALARKLADRLKRMTISPELPEG
jgi:hypothetical protein